MQAIPIRLEDDTRQQLEAWVRAGKTERRLANRARIILESAAGTPAKDIAAMVGVQPYVVSRWRRRFVDAGLPGLSDRPRSGKPAVYGKAAETRILAVLDEPPPKGCARWNGRLIAAHLGDVSVDFVWAVMRRHQISLQRRRSWCVSTDPEFAPKAADIVGLYLDPPANAVVLCVDEKPMIQALERAQGWLRLPDGKTLTGFSDRYKRHGTTTLFAALEVATGMVHAGHYQRRRRREFLDFMNDLVAAYPDRQLHIILDNLSTHKKKNGRWLGQHPNVHFHFTPTNASWLNQVEVFFSILTRAALTGASFTSVRDLRRAITNFITAHNGDAAPFEWKKTEVHPKALTCTYSHLHK